jgi:hypothetical protein
MSSSLISLLVSSLFNGSGVKTYVVNSEAEMLALPAVVGDIAIRTDLNNLNFRLIALPPTALANWQSQGDLVTSVFTRVGNIVAQSGDYTTDLVTEGAKKYFADALALTAVQKTNNVTGYEISGGTTSKTLTVSENSTIDQNLSTTSQPNFNSVKLSNNGLLNTNSGVRFAQNSEDYKIGYDNRFGILYNIPGSDGSDQHIFTRGDVTGGSFFGLFRIRNDGRVSQADQAFEAQFNFNADIKLPHISTPTDNPTAGLFVYSKPDNKLYYKTPAGTEVEIGTAAGDLVTSVFTRTGNVTAQSGDYTTDLVTEATNLYFTDSRALGAVEKTNNATGYSISGGTTSKTLIVSENCAIDQNLNTASTVQYSGVNLTPDAPLTVSTGYGLNGIYEDYRIGFDGAKIRYNIDVAASSHSHVFSFGSVSTATYDDKFIIRGDGVVSQNAGFEGGFNFAGNLKILHQATPANTPTAGVFLYAKADNALYIKDSAGVEKKLDTGNSGAVESVFGRTGPVVGEGNDYANVIMTIRRVSVDESITLNNIGTLGIFKGYGLNSAEPNFKFGYDFGDGSQKFARYNAGAIAVGNPANTANGHKFTFGVVGTSEETALTVWSNKVTDTHGALGFLPATAPPANAVDGGVRVYFDTADNVLKMCDTTSVRALDSAIGNFETLPDGISAATFTRNLNVLLCDTTSNSQEVLINAADLKDKIFTIKKIAASNTVVINTVGSALIDGSSGTGLLNVFSSVTLISDGINFFILSRIGT